MKRKRLLAFCPSSLREYRETSKCIFQGGLLLLLLLFIGSIVSCSSGSRLETVPSLMPQQTSDASSLPALGGNEVSQQAWIATIGSCGFCHASQLSPGATWLDKELSGGDTIVVQGKAFRAGSLVDFESAHLDESLRQLFRFGRNQKSSSEAQPFGHQGFEWMSEQDLALAVSFVQGLQSGGEISKPDADRKPEQAPSSWFNVFGSSSAEYSRGPTREVPGVVPSLSKAEPISYGQYLKGSVARCQVCHQGVGGIFSSGDPFAGGRVVERGSRRAIAPSLVDLAANHDSVEIERLLRAGLGTDGQELDNTLCPTDFIGALPVTELEALALGLKSLAPEGSDS